MLIEEKSRGGILIDIGISEGKPYVLLITPIQLSPYSMGHHATAPSPLSVFPTIPPPFCALQTLLSESPRLAARSVPCLVMLPLLPSPPPSPNQGCLGMAPWLSSGYLKTRSFCPRFSSSWGARVLLGFSPGQAVTYRWGRGREEAHRRIWSCHARAPQ